MLPSARFKALIEGSTPDQASLPAMTTREIAAVSRTLDSVVEGAGAWCGEHTVLNRGTAIPLSLIMSVLYPDADDRSTLLRVKTALWVYGLDDILDDPKTSAQSAQQLVAECRSIASCPVGSEAILSDCGRALGQLKREFASCALFGHIWPACVSSLSRLLDGMMFEFWLRLWRTEMSEAARVPNPDEYLYFGTSSIGLAQVFLLSVIPTNDETVVPHLPQLVPLADRCALVMRLANDLRSFEAEDRVGKANSIHAYLSMNAGRTAMAVADARLGIENLLETSRRRLSSAWRGSGTRTGIEKRFVRATAFGIDLYSTSDFRTLSAELFD